MQLQRPTLPLGHKKLSTKGMYAGGMAPPHRRALTSSESVQILLAVSLFIAVRWAPDATNKPAHKET